MAVKLQLNDIADCKIGVSSVTSIYLGTELVWPDSPTPPTPATRKYTLYLNNNTEVSGECSGSTANQIYQMEFVHDGALSTGADYSAITSADIGECVTAINGGFSGCTNLTSVTFNNSYPDITVIGNGAFAGCHSLTDIDLNDIPNVETIGNYAFRDCSSLTQVYISDLVTSIGDMAFAGCSGLTTVVVVTDTPPTLGQYVFYDNIPYNKLEGITIYVPNERVAAYMDAWSDYADMIRPIAEYEQDCLTYKALIVSDDYSDEIYVENDGLTELTQQEVQDALNNAGILLGKVFIGCDVETIGQNAFDSINGMGSTVEIPDNVTSIGSYAFRDTSFGEYIIPSGVTSIGEYAFDLEMGTQNGRPIFRFKAAQPDANGWSSRMFGGQIGFIGWHYNIDKVIVPVGSCSDYNDWFTDVYGLNDMPIYEEGSDYQCNSGA